MDQLRNVLGWLKRNHFWVLTALVAFIGLFSWWTASGSLSAQFQKNKSQIEAEFNSLSTLRSKPFHPNQTINEKQQEEIDKAAKSVGAIWQKLYERQTENVLEWPATLSKAFRDHVEKLSFGADIPPRLRQEYQDYVERHFPTLPKMIGARVLREGEGGMFGGGGRGEFGGSPYPGLQGVPGLQPAGAAGEEEEGDYIVEWLDQAHVREELNFPQRPSPVRIWWTQENLWVYETLLRVIRNTNEAAGATRMSNAAVRTLYSLQVGRDAAKGSRTANRIYKPPAATPAPGSEMMPGAEGGPVPGGEFAGEMAPRGAEMSFQENAMGQGPLSPEQEQAFLFTNRYLGEDGKPLAGGGAAAGGEVADPAAPAPAIDPASFGREFKRLPVRMILQMDERWLPHLISQCASQPLQVEVTEVRINPDDGGGVDGGVGFGGGFRGGYGGGPSGANLFPERTGLQTFRQQPQMVNVVIQGIIYIFNKPDPGALQSTAEGTAPMAGL
jgi:hypothetical protein